MGTDQLATVRTAAAERGTPATGFRPDIQGLRAVAVGLVVLFHLWPNRVAGGFVGVDVFFVISGYLITAHLHRELDRTGTVSLRQFWARRIRRLLPASFVVLAASLVAVVVFLPVTIWAETARQVAASALYVQNWALVADAVDYLAQDNKPTVAQHYWSLSVEEQFYLLWPILAVVVALLVRGRSRSRHVDIRRGLFLALVLVAAVSLAYSMIATAHDQSTAYFHTGTRVWEFAAGALLALAGWRTGPGPVLARLLGWGGLVAIGCAGLLLDGGSQFPGWLALVPVLGAVAVLAAGSGRRSGSAAWLLSLRPVVFVGDISYSVYLWHWPLVVVVPYATGVALRTGDKLAILVATVLLAWLTKLAVEDRLRVGPLLGRAPWRSFTFALVGMAVLTTAGWAVRDEVADRAAASAEATRQTLAGEVTTGCLGPAALDPDNGCDSVVGAGSLLPSPEAASKETLLARFPNCQTPLRSARVETCVLGSTVGRPSRVVAIVGDSHATAWFNAFDRLGKKLNWRVLAYTKASCPVTAAVRTLPSEARGEQEACSTWSREVRERLRSDESVSEVYVTAYSSAYGWRLGDLRGAHAASEGFALVWREWLAQGKEVRVLRDVPRTNGDNVPDCLAQHEQDRLACAVPRAEALPEDVLVGAARGVPKVDLIDLTDQFCDDTWCYPVVGDVIVYRDYSHITGAYAGALVPYLRRAIAATER